MQYKFDFLDDLHVQRLFSVLNESGQAYVVGGAVRNALLGVRQTDIDFATTLRPEVVQTVLRRHHITVIPTGIDYGTVTAVIEGRHYEITTFRSDIATDGRHAVVRYTTDISVDAARRDFTINALYVDVAGQVYDFYDGQGDLKKRTVRFIGKPAERIQEDALRMLRFFRFTSAYGKEMDADGLRACVQRKGDLVRLSVERVQSEILKILMTQRAGDVVDVMVKNRFFDVIFSAHVWDKTLFENLVRIEEKIQLFDPWRRLFLIAPLAYTDFKFPTKQKQRFKMLSDKKLSGHLLSDFYYLGRDRVIDLLVIDAVKTGRSIVKIVQQVQQMERPVFPLTGQDFMAVGLSGRAIGAAKRRLEKAWLESDCSLVKKDLLLLL